MKKEDVKKVADNYVDFFDKSKGFTEKERKENYETVVNSYYDLATDFYEYGWGQSFHFAVQAKGEPLKQAIARHEHYLALRLKLEKGDNVLVCLVDRSFTLFPLELHYFFPLLNCAHATCTCIHHHACTIFYVGLWLWRRRART